MQIRMVKENGQVIDVCTIHINYPVRFFRY